MKHNVGKEPVSKRSFRNDLAVRSGLHTQGNLALEKPKKVMSYLPVKTKVPMADINPDKNELKGKVPTRRQ